VSGKKEAFQFSYLDLVIALFVAVLITSNIASSAKIVDLKLSVLGINLAFDGGTLLFPVSYVIGDLLTEVYGFRVARRAIWTGFLVLAFSAFFFFVLRVLPAEAAWEGYAGTAAFNAILGGMSSGGIVLSSLSGYLFGSFFNSALHSWLKVLMNGRLLWVRAIGSSIVGELLDSFIFVGVASLLGVFPWVLFKTLVLTNYLVKLTIEIIITPLTYFSVWSLKKAEGLDVYDTGLKYNPFRFN